MESIPAFISFDFPTSWRHGKGLAASVGQYVQQLGCRKPLVLTDDLLVRLNVVEPVFASLRASGIPYGLCGDISEEPTVALFDTLVRKLDLQQYDVIIAVGGGSVIDVAKGLALVETFGGHIRDYAGFNKVPGVPRIKTITIPTTSGTGSEISDGVALIDKEHGTKFLVISKKICPTIALTDPLLTLSMPPAVTATSGVDALVHAVESYISKGAGPVTAGFSLKAMSLLSNNLQKAFRDGLNLQAREQMQIGATMAMIAGMNAYLGLCHALAMPLCAMYHMPHGQAVGMVLAPVLAYNAAVSRNKVVEILRLMGFLSGDGQDDETLQAALGRLTNFFWDLGLGTRLRDYGFQESHMNTIVTATMGSAQRPSNPRDPSPEDIANLVRPIV